MHEDCLWTRIFELQEVLLSSVRSLFCQIALSCWHSSTIKIQESSGAIYSDLSVKELTEQQRSDLCHHPTPPAKKRGISTLSSLQCWLRSRVRPHFQNSLVRKIPWRSKWQPTPVFSSGKSHGQRSLAGYGPWGCKELDKTERLTLSLQSALREGNKVEI